MVKNPKLRDKTSASLKHLYKNFDLEYQDEYSYLVHLQYVQIQ